MRLISFLLGTAFLLSGCETPPKPTSYPKNAQESKVIKLNEFLGGSENNIVPKNPYDKGGWQYSMTVYGNLLKNSDYHAQLWYMAQHADKIVLVGENTNIQHIQNRLIQSGSTPNIELTPTCYKTSRNKCSELVQVYFYKFNPVVSKNNDV